MLWTFDDDRFKNPRPQSFSFPFGIINHCLQNPSSASGLQKLQQTCKYFYSRHKIQFLDNSLYPDDRGYIEHLHYIDDRLAGISFWLTKHLAIEHWKDEEKPISFPDWQIFRCTITSLTVSGAKLRIDDYEFITKEGTIEILSLYRSPIVDFRGVEVPVDIILNKTPKAKIICYHNNETATFDYACFKKLNFSNKLKSFNCDIRCSQGNFKPELLLDFMKLNAGPSSLWYLTFTCPIQTETARNCIQPWLDFWETDKPIVEYR